MSVRIHVQFMSPQGKDDTLHGTAKAVVHDGIVDLVRRTVGGEAEAPQPPSVLAPKLKRQGASSSPNLCVHAGACGRRSAARPA